MIIDSRKLIKAVLNIKDPKAMCRFFDTIDFVNAKLIVGFINDNKLINGKFVFDINHSVWRFSAWPKNSKNQMKSSNS